MVEKLNYTFDLHQIRAEVSAALGAVDLLSRQVKQLLLTCPETTTDCDFFGTGKIYDSQLKKHQIPQSDFCKINPRFAGTYLEEIWKSFPYKVGRVRIMLLTQKHSYTLHRDMEPRYHIAVDTSPDTYLIYKDRPEWYHIPADSHLYRVETNHFHSAINCSPKLRTHIVFDALEAYSL